MEKAKKGEIALLFMDASHFVMGCDFLGFIYGRVRRFVPTFSGRMRYNVLGAIDFISKKVLTVTNDKYITATEVCEMLWKISKEYENKITHLLLDNARYQKCNVVQELAAKLGIRLVYIPPYSPNLNLIERLWKFVKAELRTRYYDNFSLFKEKINSIIDSTTHENQARPCLKNKTCTKSKRAIFYKAWINMLTTISPMNNGSGLSHCCHRNTRGRKDAPEKTTGRC